MSMEKASSDTLVQALLCMIIMMNSCSFHPNIKTRNEYMRNPTTTMGNLPYLESQ